MIDSPTVYLLNTYGALILLVLVCLYLWLAKKKPQQAFHVAFASIVTYFVTVILKNLFDASRPYLLNGNPPQAGDFTAGSFPSFHTALAFVIATTVVFYHRKLGIILFLLAALIGFGRVVANVHFPIDVAAGAILGTIIAFIFEKTYPFKRS